MRPVSRLLLTLALVSGVPLLAACETTLPSANFPVPTYDHLAPLRFNVAAIDIERAFEPSAESPHVELLFPVRPDEAAASWARGRLVAGGQARRLRFLVRDASVVEVELEQSGGLTGAFTTEQSERYEATLSVEVELLDETRNVLGRATAGVKRTITVPEDASLIEREKTWYELTRQLTDDLGAQLEKTLKSAFFKYLQI